MTGNSGELNVRHVRGVFARRQGLGPPVTELPGLADPGNLVWLSGSVALAIPFLLIYTTGVELLLLCRGRDVALNSEANMDVIRRGIAGGSGDGGLQFLANGKPAFPLGGQMSEHQFQHRVWVEDVKGDLILSLQWPEVKINYGERIVSEAVIADALRKVIQPW